MIGAAARSWVDWGGPFIQWSMFSFMRNVTVVVLLSQILSTCFQSEGRLSEAVWVWTLTRSTWAGPLWSLKKRTEGTGHLCTSCLQDLAPISTLGLG